VRHDAYQRSLAVSNPNARTPLPIHTFGLAFDISVLHAPLASVREIRDVLRQMRDEGDLFFVAEVRQLVFHVVVAPGRASYHAAVFDALVAAPPPLWRPNPLPAGYPARGIESLFPLLVRYEQPLAGSFGPPMLVGLSAVAAVWRRRVVRS
jgi:hypothetical protein